VRDVRTLADVPDLGGVDAAGLEEFEAGLADSRPDFELAALAATEIHLARGGSLHGHNT
jgi:hypothetical protein